jgi:hypothetical protein
VNSSATLLTTINLFDAIQLCPQLIKRPLTAPVDAFSISASSQTMNGSLPPNSRTVFFSCDVALCATLAPTGTLPVKVTALIPLESISVSAMLESPTAVLKTPSGTPALLKVFSISIPHCIVALAGFNTMVFPTINEGAANLSPCQ